MMYDMTPPNRLAALLLFLSILSFFLTACEGEDAVCCAPRLQNLTIAQTPARGEVPISFQIVGQSKKPIDIFVEYQLNDDGEWQTASLVHGVGQARGLLVSGESENTFTLVWDSYGDIGQVEAEAKIRITADNGKTHFAESEMFTIRNDNAAPLATLLHLLNEGRGLVEVRLGLYDEESEPVSLGVFYTIDSGEHWRKASIAQDLDALETTSEGAAYAFHWQAGEDLQGLSERVVSLKFIPIDALGAGQTAYSDAFPLALSREEFVELSPFFPTQRGEIPIQFSIFGHENERFNADFSFSEDWGESYAPLTLVFQTDKRPQNLIAAPEGAMHAFFWDSRADIEADIFRGLLVKVSITRAGDDSGYAVSARSGLFDVNNAPLTSLPVISEVYLGTEDEDAAAKEAFIEIAAPAGTSLEGLRVYEIRKDGFTGEAMNEAFIRFEEEIKVDASGVFLIAGVDSGYEPDYAWERFHTFFRRGAPYTIQLDYGEDYPEHDALGFGGIPHRGKGDPAPTPLEGESLSRIFANTDAGDNALDFVVTRPTPGEALFYPPNGK